MNELELEILYTAKTIRKVELEEYRKDPCDASRSKLFRAISFLLGISRSALISKDITQPVYNDIEEELRDIARSANDIFMDEEVKPVKVVHTGKRGGDDTRVDDKT
jgi:hypothetical protein